MNKEERRELFNRDYEELVKQCNNLTEQMESYMGNQLDYQTILTLKSTSLDALFEIQKKITEMDCTYELLELTGLEAVKVHAELVESLLGTLEKLETIFN